MAVVDVLAEMKRAIAPEVTENLPVELQKNVIDTLDDYRCWAHPTYDPDIKEKYENLNSKREKIFDEILCLAPFSAQPALKSLLDDFSDVNVLLECLCSKMIYKQGLRDGYQLAEFFKD